MMMIEPQINVSDNLNETLAAAPTTADVVANVTHDATFLNVGYLSRILPSVVAMSILFVLSAVGNVTVFSTLVGSRLRKTRISTIILHLTISDLIVTFLVIPSEVQSHWIGTFWLRGDCFAQRKHYCFPPSSLGFESRLRRDFFLFMA